MSNDVDRYLDEFGRELKQADARHNASRPSRTRVRIAVAGVAVAVLAAIAIAVVPSGGGVPEAHAGAVRKAQRALLMQNSILHSHVINTVTQLDDAIFQDRDPYAYERGGTSFETWRTFNPARHRMVFSELNADGTVRRSDEASWARGVSMDYNPQTKTARRIVGVRQADSSDDAPLSPAGENPVAALRKVLATGQFKDTGLHDLNGREVRRLAGIVEVRGELPRTKQHPEARPIVSTEQVEYDVDPQTFTPIQMRQWSGIPGVTSNVMIWDFKAFEWLPITPENLKLLTIHPAPGTAIKTQTLKQFYDEVHGR